MRISDWSSDVCSSDLTWVGNRRWDLRFRSGETLSLPEGEMPAKEALAKFAHMDGANRLLGRGILRFDMRDPTRFVLRLPHEGQVAPAKLDAARDAVDAAAADSSAEKGEVMAPPPIDKIITALAARSWKVFALNPGPTTRDTPPSLPHP